jgi:hypothetical protein
MCGVSQTESGGRYQRSASSLVIAMVVTVGAVVVLVGLRSLLSEDVEVRPPDLDYLERVVQVQDAGVEIVYPADLPDGWQATRVELEPGEPPAFGLNMLTDDEKFAGLRQENASIDDLLERYVVEDTDQGEPWRTTGSAAETWETYSDERGDLAYAAAVGETTVLVYGSADRADLETLVGLLTTRPVERPTPSP